MSDAVIISIVTAISGVATVVLNNKMNKVHKDVVNVKESVVKVKEEINGRMTKLLELTRESGKAQGNKEGREEQRESKPT